MKCENWEVSAAALWMFQRLWNQLNRTENDLDNRFCVLTTGWKLQTDPHVCVLNHWTLLETVSVIFRGPSESVERRTTRKWNWKMFKTSFYHHKVFTVKSPQRSESKNNTFLNRVWSVWTCQVVFRWLCLPSHTYCHLQVTPSITGRRSRREAPLGLRNLTPPSERTGEFRRGACTQIITEGRNLLPWMDYEKQGPWAQTAKCPPPCYKRPPTDWVSFCHLASVFVALCHFVVLSNNKLDKGLISLFSLDSVLTSRESGANQNLWLLISLLLLTGDSWAGRTVCRWTLSDNTGWDLVILSVKSCRLKTSGLKQL